jgi:hypothetical protein
MRIRDRKPLLAVVAVAAVAAVVLLVLLVGDEEKPPVPAERTAPPLAGTAVRGGRVSLERLRGHAVLVSFLNTRADATLRNDPSRAQTVFLRSMQTQHARFGLRVIIVDAAEVAGAGRPSRNELVNYTYDWNLDRAIALLADDGSLARRFSVRRAPTTFLIDQDGALRRRWNGFAGAAELDFAIRSLEGRSPTD